MRTPPVVERCIAVAVDHEAPVLRWLEVVDVFPNQTAEAIVKVGRAVLQALFILSLER